jgi:predicted metal-dependent enzyme (double-stranded beta helix superfamily)
MEDDPSFAELPMCDTGYSVSNLVADLQKLAARGAAEREMLAAVPDLAKRLVLMKHNWLRDYMRETAPERNQAGRYVLHEEPAHGLTISIVTWKAGDQTSPHDHGTWSVVAGLEGAETNQLWKRVDDGSVPGRAEIVPGESQSVDPATILAMASDVIHSVHNESGAPSVTLQLYGRNVDHTPHSRYDPVRRTIEPYDPGVAVHRIG